jgi:hypothetical protein
MKGPNEVPVIIAQLQEGKTHQGRLGKIEAARAIGE